METISQTVAGRGKRLVLHALGMVLLGLATGCAAGKGGPARGSAGAAPPARVISLYLRTL